MGADYYLVNKEKKVKLEVFGRATSLYDAQFTADFLLDNLNQDIQLVELNELSDLESRYRTEIH
jgi:hypothetical protein